MLAKVDFAFCFTQIACLRINSANHPALKQKSPSLREISNIAPNLRYQILVQAYQVNWIPLTLYGYVFSFALSSILFDEAHLFTPFSLVGLSSITLVS